jgi:hypothetical protein
MSQVGLEVIAINSSTYDEASRLRQEELLVTARMCSVRPKALIKGSLGR